MSIRNSMLRKGKVALIVLMSLLVSIAPMTNVSAWGGENLNQIAGGTDLVCVRDLATSTADDCDEYIHPAATYTLFNRFIDRLTTSGARLDERNFVQICEINSVTDACSGNYVDTINITPGKQYQVYVMFHNNAATNSDGSPNLIYSSHNARVNAIVPDSIGANGQKNISSTISWDTPGQPGVTSSVWDEATIKSSGAANLRYVSGSAKIHMNKFDTSYDITGTVDQVLSTSLFNNTGTFLGYWDATQQKLVLDGIVFGCTEYSGWITYRFAVESPEPEPCEFDPSLPADDPNCRCKWDHTLPPDDPKCVGPGDTGGNQFTLATVSLIAFLVLAGVTVGYLHLHNIKQKRDNED